jgi:hypothetical protein
MVLGSGRLCVDAQRVNVGVHKVSDRHIDQSMASYGGQAREFVRHDPDPEMTFSVARSLVTDMQVTLVDNFQFYGLEDFYEARADFYNTLFAHGNTNLKGLTVTLL